MMSEVGLDLLLGMSALLLAAAMVHPLPSISLARTLVHPALLSFAAAFALSIVLLQSGLGLYRNGDAGWLDPLARLAAAAAFGGYLVYLMMKLAGFGEHPRVLVVHAVVMYLAGVLFVRGIVAVQQALQVVPKIGQIGRAHV